MIKRERKERKKGKKKRRKKSQDGTSQDVPSDI